MSFETSATSFPSLLPTVGGEIAFTAAFALIILKTPAQATIQRILGLAILAAGTYFMERSIVQLCLSIERPHWAATTASLLWVQLLSASELILASRVDASQLAHHGTRQDGPLQAATSAIGLLWNMRRVGTSWQVKNVPSAASQQAQSRTGFVIRRAAVTLVAYLFVDFVVSQPPADAALVQPEKATLFSLHTLDVGDVIFRVAMTISYWIITATLNLFMTNVGAVFAVLLGLSQPVDCPPLYGSFLDAYTVRCFWG